MASAPIEFDEDVIALLQRLDRPLQDAARDLIVMELYRRELVSSGKAADLLGMSREAFLDHAASLGVPYFRLSADEVRADADRIRDIAPPQ